MNYGLRYTIPFATLNNVPCVVEIEQEEYAGESQELTPASSPFTIDIEDEEFIYTPTRFSTGTIRIIGNDYLQSLFTTAYQQYRVTLKRNNEVAWCGFIKPELYTQDYVSDLFELEIECMSALSALEYIDYKQDDEEKRSFVSLWDLLKKCISTSNARYNSVYIPHVYAKSKTDYDSGVNVLSEMTVSEQNFFDEEDKPMKLKEVLEEICKLLNWTCVDYRGDLYFVDVDHIGKYYKYDQSLNNKLSEVSTGVLNVRNDIGYSGTGHSLDIIPGYNKATVKTSNYPISETLIEDIDFKKAKLLASSYETDTDYRPTKAFRKKYFLNTSIDLRLYKESNGTMVQVNPNDYAEKPNELNDLFGTRLVQTFTYDPNDTEITEYNYEDSIQFRLKDLTNISVNDNELVIASFVCKTAKVFPVGVFAISGSVMPFYKETDMSLFSEENTSPDRIINMKVRIGNKYYGTTGWVTGERLFSPTNLGGTGFRNIRNEKTPNMPYKGLKGCILKVDKTLVGDLQIDFLMVKPDETGRPYVSSCIGYYLKDFKFVYQKPDDVTDSEDSNSDRIYENVVNEKYINELGEIEFKISSYNNDGACYSKVMLGEEYLTDNLYSAIENKAIRPEEQLIRRIINRYSAPHIKLTQVIKETSELTPITFLSDTFMVGKKFIISGGSIDYKMEQFECVMIEV